MTLVLMPVPERQWREPSQAQPKDQLGNQNQTRFRLTARLNDGFIRWRGWFDSRDDADAFLYALARCIALGEPIPIEMWRLPSPWWHPDLGEGVTYEFATVVFLTTAGSLQTYTSAVDWWNNGNTVEALGAGGSGGAINSATPESASGGGGGEYRKIVNFSFAAPGSTTAQYQVGSGGAAVSPTANGNAGGNTWFNGASFGAGTLAAGGGGAGQEANASSVAGASGGSGGTGVVGSNGGGSGSCSGTTVYQATGGGGAGGSNGAGNASANLSSDTQNAGGSGDQGSGGAGGSASSGSAAGAGGNGTEWDGTHGSGGGGGACNNAVAGSGGNYGGGGGALRNPPSGPGNTSGAGIQGIVVLTYTPFKRGGFMPFF